MGLVLEPGLGWAGLWGLGLGWKPGLGWFLAAGLSWALCGLDLALALVWALGS